VLGHTRENRHCRHIDNRWQQNPAYNSLVNPWREKMPTIISVGATGDDVKRLQRALARTQNWNPFGPINGIFDSSLQQSVENYQKSYGLTVDGIVGPLTWAKLPSYREASPTLRNGSGGPAVVWLQAIMAASLTRFSPYTGPLDGVFGPDTEAAVTRLQNWASVPATGVVDDATWFVWWEPGAANQLTVEGACGLTSNLPEPPPTS
jgi:peptidoglycan hydrolase-like protein with peptidoglycan-binding domain